MTPGQGCDCDVATLIAGEATEGTAASAVLRPGPMRVHSERHVLRGQGAGYSVACTSRLTGPLGRDRPGSRPAAGTGRPGCRPSPRPRSLPRGSAPLTKRAARTGRPASQARDGPTDRRSARWWWTRRRARAPMARSSRPAAASTAGRRPGRPRTASRTRWPGARSAGPGTTRAGPASATGCARRCLPGRTTRPARPRAPPAAAAGAARPPRTSPARPGRAWRRRPRSRTASFPPCSSAASPNAVVRAAACH